MVSNRKRKKHSENKRTDVLKQKEKAVSSSRQKLWSVCAGNPAVLLFAVVVSAAFLLLFSPSTSPLYSKYTMWCYDSPYYMVLGKSILAGKIPYKDVFEPKGPYIYFIEALGFTIYNSRIGIFVVQFVFLSVTLIFLVKISRLFVKKKRDVLITVFCFLFLFMFTILEGNLTEEYSLPFIFASVYLGLRYYILSDLDEHPKQYAVVYGACFGFLAFLRLNNAVAIACIILTILFFLLKNKKFVNVLSNAAFFILGLGFTVLPIIVYFYENHALNDLIYGTFIFPYKYATGSKDLQNALQFSLITGMILLNFVLASTLFYFKFRNKRLLFFSTASLLLTFPALSLGYGYPHYETINLINLVLALSILLCLIEGKCFFIKKRRILAILTLCCLAYPFAALPNFSYDKTRLSDLHAMLSLRNVQNSIETRIAESVPKAELDRTFVYGMSSPKWYLLSGTIPQYKYAGAETAEQYRWMDSKVFTDFNNRFQSNPPLWFIMPESEKINDEIIKNEIQKHYVLDHTKVDDIDHTGEYLYYKRKN